MSNSFHPRQGIKNLPEICVRHGLSQMVICPGSRNAPLIISLASHPDLTCHSITDERAAGYFALGMSQMSKLPTGIVCTSGTAVLNIAPAIAEAYYQNIPLVILTADRPAEWIDQSDGQTIRQQNIFHNYIKQSFELPLETEHPDDLWSYNRTISQAIDVACQFPSGPVHLNIPLREPLYTPLPEEYHINHIIATASFERSLSRDAENDLLDKWSYYNKKVIVFGMQSGNDRLQYLAEQLAQRSDTLVFAENLANISGADMVYDAEPLLFALSEEEKLNIQPDLVITVGSGIVSKRLKQFLRSFKPQEHWHFSDSDNYTDTFKSLSRLIPVDPVPVLGKLLKTRMEAVEDFNKIKKSLGSIRLLHEEFVASAGFTDIKMIHSLLEAIPGDSIVHLANSSPVRYAQLSPTRNDLTYFSNRGTSGIDGCTSTAAGSAYISDKNTFLITGDLAFIYDSHGMWNKILSGKLHILVLNNQGGNIFSLIDSSPEMDRVKSYFETPHQVNLKFLSQAYGLEYYECSNDQDIPSLIHKMVNSELPGVLEIKTDPALNTQRFKEYYQFIKQKL